MSKINLLPKEIKEQIEISKRNRFLLSIFTLLVFLLTSYGILFYFGYQYLSKNLSKSRQILAAKEKSLESYGNIEKEAFDFQERLNNYKKIEKSNLYWSKIVEEISSKTTPNMYILNIKATSDTKTKGEITGNAADKFLIATFVSSLLKSDLIKSVDIESVNIIIDPFATRKTNNFKLTFTTDLEKIK
ncbi:MAG: PilN domain-containing protein [Patescibacteria group bacterium]|nr:PilN domain-containing protein [Patescibacteria group bacterium]